MREKRTSRSLLFPQRRAHNCLPREYSGRTRANRSTLRAVGVWIGLEARSISVAVLPPTALTSFEGGAATHGVYHTVLEYIYSYCLRFAGSDSELTRSMSMVYYHWGSRSFEPAYVKSPGQLPGGGTLGYWHHDRKRGPAAGAAVHALCQ